MDAHVTTPTVSHAMAARAVAVALSLGTGGLLTNVKGGVPLAFDGVQVGGLGVAGGTPDQDAVIAVATLEALRADPVEVPA